MKFRVWGPVPSGSQLYAVFQQPGGSAPWLTFDCETAGTQKNYWRETECGGRQVEDKSLTAAGPVSFTIKMRNELAGTDTAIFVGRMKVAKTRSNEHGPKAVGGVGAVLRLQKSPHSAVDGIELIIREAA
jgi:hypothetical protein